MASPGIIEIVKTVTPPEITVTTFVPTSIPGFFAVNDVVATPSNMDGNVFVFSGTLVADTYSTLYTNTNGGMLSILGVRNLGATASHNVTMKVTVNGTVIMEEAYPFAATLRAVYALGYVDQLTTPVLFDSLTVELMTNTGGFSQLQLGMHIIEGANQAV